MVDKKMNITDKVSIANSFYKSIKSFGATFPVLIGVILLIGLFKIYIPSNLISSIFTGELFRDTFFGSIIGSISAGNPITSYIIGGEMLEQGISLVAVTAFIVAWVTVGIVQLPAEAVLLGKKFAIVRNLIAFLFSILVAVITVILVSLL